MLPLILMGPAVAALYARLGKGFSVKVEGDPLDAIRRECGLNTSEKWTASRGCLKVDTRSAYPYTMRKVSRDV